jgi:hypothetical protein
MRLQALADLKAAGLVVIPITGRPIGWCEPFMSGATTLAGRRHGGRKRRRGICSGGQPQNYMPNWPAALVESRIARYQNLYQQDEATRCQQSGPHAAKLRHG